MNTSQVLVCWDGTPVSCEESLCTAKVLWRFQALGLHSLHQGFISCTHLYGSSTWIQEVPGSKVGIDWHRLACESRTLECISTSAGGLHPAYCFLSWIEVTTRGTTWIPCCSPPFLFAFIAFLTLIGQVHGSTSEQLGERDARWDCQQRGWIRQVLAFWKLNVESLACAQSIGPEVNWVKKRYPVHPLNYELHNMSHIPWVWEHKKKWKSCFNLKWLRLVGKSWHYKHQLWPRWWRCWQRAWSYLQPWYISSKQFQSLACNICFLWVMKGTAARSNSRLVLVASLMYHKLSNIYVFSVIFHYFPQSTEACWGCDLEKGSRSE